MSLVLYAYSTNERSSRGMERRCRQDIAYRVITGNQVPDHATIARFVARHERALAGLFGEVLRLCGEAGLVKPEVIAVDGTRMEDTRRGAHRVLKRRGLTRPRHPTRVTCRTARSPGCPGASGRPRTAIAVPTRPPGEPPRRQPYPASRTQLSPAPSRVTGQPVLRRPVELRW